MSATMYVFVTHDENGIASTIHRTEAEAYEALRKHLNDTPVDYQDPLPEDATQVQIEVAADGRAQFAWVIEEHSVPWLPEGKVVTDWGFRHPGWPHAQIGPHVETSYMGQDGWRVGPYTEKDVHSHANGKPVVKRERVVYPDQIGEWTEVES
jgi:hypothetical protein